MAFKPVNPEEKLIWSLLQTVRNLPTAVWDGGFKNTKQAQLMAEQAFLKDL